MFGSETRVVETPAADRSQDIKCPHVHARSTLMDVSRTFDKGYVNLLRECLAATILLSGKGRDSDVFFWVLS